MGIVLSGSSFWDTLLQILKDIGLALVKWVDGLIGGLFDTMIQFFCLKMLALWSVFLGVIDEVEDIFNIFAGTTQIYYRNGTQISTGTFLQVLLFQDSISKAFWGVTLIGMALAFFFTIYSTMHSISEMALGHEKPLGKVLAGGIKSALIFLLFPSTVFVVVELSDIVVSQVNASFYSNSSDTTASLGTFLFLIFTLEASTRGLKTGEAVSINDSVRSKYLRGDVVSSEKCDYWNFTQIIKDFDHTEINYLNAIVASVFVLVIMLGLVFLILARIFELALLYVVAPLFVSTMTIDEGELFKKWREMFLAKLVCCIGPILTMRLVLIMIPFLMGDGILMTPKDSIMNITVNVVVKFFLIAGSIYAAYKSQHLMLQILNPQAAMSAQAHTGVVVAAAITAAKLAMQAASGGAGGGIGGGAGGGAGSGMKMASDLGKMLTSEANSNGGGGYTTESQQFKGQ